MKEATPPPLDSEMEEDGKRGLWETVACALGCEEELLRLLESGELDADDLEASP